MEGGGVRKKQYDSEKNIKKIKKGVSQQRKGVSQQRKGVSQQRKGICKPSCGAMLGVVKNLSTFSTFS